MTNEASVAREANEDAISPYQTKQSTFIPMNLTSSLVEQTFYTSATHTLDKISQESNLTQSTETVLNEVSGIILAVEEGYVKVKLGIDTVVDFPKMLFQGKPFVSFGQHIKYQIKKDARGYRYQDFVEDAAQPDRKLKEKIHELLGE